MSDVIETEVIETEAGIFRIEIEQDDDAMSPREHDNVSVLVLDARNMRTGIDLDETSDGSGATVREVIDRVREGRMSEQGAARYLRGVLGAWAVVPLYVHDDWAPTVSAARPTSQLGVRVDGFAFDTAARRAVMGPETPEQAEEWLIQDVEAFSGWTSGEYVGFTVSRLSVDDWDKDRPDVDDVADDPDTYVWDTLDSVWSIDDAEYAMTEARDVVNGYTAAEFPSPGAARALAAQV